MSKGDYDIGYKKPPKEHRFKKGRSGNPNGRPKGSRSLPEEVRRALRKTITVTEDGKRRKINVVEAALRRLIEQAVAKGEMRAITHILSLADAYGMEAARAARPADDEALIAAYVQRLSEREDEA